jgi:hypothetical protein
MLKNDTKFALQLKSRPPSKVQRNALTDDDHHEHLSTAVQRIEISEVSKREDREPSKESENAALKAIKQQRGPPAWLQRRLAQLPSDQLDAKEVLKRDMDALPDESGINYQAVSVEDFGKRLLQSMGWREGMVVGRNQKVKMNPLPKQEPRPERLGLGASINPGETQVVRGVGVVLRVNQRLNSSSSSLGNGYGLMVPSPRRDGGRPVRRDRNAGASPREDPKRDGDDRSTSRHESRRSRRDDQRRERSLSPYARSRNERNSSSYSRSRRDRTPSPQWRSRRDSDDNFRRGPRGPRKL